MRIIEKEGIELAEFENGELTARLSKSYRSDEVVVPAEVNGKPVASFVFSASDVEQKIKRIVLPSSMKYFSGDVFGLEYSINIEIDENNPYLFSDGKAVYSKNRRDLIFFAARGDKEYTVYADCKTIAKKAFALSKKLKRIILPSSLKTIETNAFTSCIGLEELEFSDGLVSIGNSAFKNCPDLKKLSLPTTLESIGSEAFAENPNAIVVDLPKSLSEIGECAFSENFTLVLNEKNPYFICRDGFILSHDGRKLVCLAKPLESGVMIIPEYITEISPKAFQNNSKIERIVFPKLLQTIGHNAFFGVENLREIKLENVREIQKFAFGSCDSLERISLKCNNIGKFIFSDCINLIEAEIDCPRTGIYMFGECVKLRKAVLKNTKTIGAGTFAGAAGLKEIVFSPELEVIEGGAFSHIGMTSLTIPKTVRCIEKYIADHVIEIHIYDNIETDISPDNDISSRDYILYVHAADTDEIKYAVPIIGDKYLKYDGVLVHRSLVGMFKGGVSFDFKKFDNCFEDAMFELENFDSDFIKAPLDYLSDKFNAGLLRLKYGYELDDNMRRKYEERLNKLSCYITDGYIKENTIEPILDPALYTYMSADDLHPLIDLSAERRLIELTAFLMRICNEKTEKGGDTCDDDQSG